MSTFCTRVPAVQYVGNGEQTSLEFPRPPMRRERRRPTSKRSFPPIGTEPMTSIDTRVMGRIGETPAGPVSQNSKDLASTISPPYRNHSRVQDGRLGNKRFICVYSACLQ